MKELMFLLIITLVSACISGTTISEEQAKNISLDYAYLPRFDSLNGIEYTRFLGLDETVFGLDFDRIELIDVGLFENDYYKFLVTKGSSLAYIQRFGDTNVYESEFGGFSTFRTTDCNDDDCIKNKIKEFYNAENLRIQDLKAYAIYYNSRYSGPPEFECFIELTVILKTNGNYLAKPISGICAIS